jgi:uncharacterized RDD family membrane protein YckC
VSVVPNRSEGLSFGNYAAPTGLQGVGFWPRAAGRLIDLLVHISVGVVAGVTVAFVVVFYAAFSAQPVEPLIAKVGATSLSTFVFSLLGALGYQTICEGISGSSLGKRVLGFTVVQEDSSPCRMRSAFIRSLSYYLDSLCLGIVAYLAMQRTSMQQRHGDGWAHTVVVRRKKLAVERQPGMLRFLGGLLLGLLFDGVMITASVALKLF